MSQIIVVYESCCLSLFRSVKKLVCYFVKFILYSFLSLLAFLTFGKFYSEYDSEYHINHSQCKDLVGYHAMTERLEKLQYQKCGQLNIDVDKGDK